MSKAEHSLECLQLAVHRDGVPLFAGLDLELKSGDLLIVQGNNGAGKSSLLQALAGLLRPAEGEILWNSAPITKSADYPRQLLYIGHLRGLYPEMTVRQNVALWASLAGADETVEAALHYFDLADIAELPVAMLSEGWRQRVALTRLLTMPCPLWLLDEPTANLDSDGVAHLHSLINTRLEQNGIVIMTTHAKVQGDRYKILNINNYKQ